jgi:hypothetical protein
MHAASTYDTVSMLRYYYRQQYSYEFCAAVVLLQNVIFLQNVLVEILRRAHVAVEMPLLSLLKVSLLILLALSLVSFFTMASTMLPLDDLELEMEEVEGLVEVSTVGRGRTSRVKNVSSVVISRGRSCCLL